MLSFSNVATLAAWLSLSGTIFEWFSHICPCAFVHYVRKLAEISRTVSKEPRQWHGGVSGTVLKWVVDFRWRRKMVAPSNLGWAPPNPEGAIWQCFWCSLVVLFGLILGTGLWVFQNTIACCAAGTSTFDTLLRSFYLEVWRVADFWDGPRWPRLIWQH